MTGARPGEWPRVHRRRARDRHVVRGGRSGDGAPPRADAL